MANLSSNDHKLDHVDGYKALSNSFSYGKAVKFDGFNYEMWFRIFMMSFKEHKKRHIVEEPNDKVGKYVNWEEDNNIVIVRIINSEQTQIATGMCYYDYGMCYYGS